jgi:hypothetical protein
MKKTIIITSILFVIVLLFERTSADSTSLKQKDKLMDVPCCLEGALTSQDPINYTTCTVTVTTSGGSILCTTTPASDGTFKCCTNISTGHHYDISVSCPLTCTGSATSVQCSNNPITIPVTCP